MKTKLPVIVLLALLVIATAIVIKNNNDKKAVEREYAEYARLAASEENTDESDAEKVKYEFVQTDPESGLAIIYTFEINSTSGESRRGSITVDGSGRYLNVVCAVAADEDADVFIFSSEISDEKGLLDAESGDVLVKIHHKDGRLIPEWLGLENMIPGEDVVENYRSDK